MKQQDSTKFEPGSSYSYSNTAYAILAQVVEKISGTSFADYMKNEIFEPLKMNNSVIYTKDTKIRNRAFGYTMEDNEIYFTDQSMTSAVQGDGGVYTSLSDYFLWNQALHNNTLIPADLQKKAWSPQYLDKEKNEGYGYGWRIKFIEDVKIVSHSGHTRGFTNYVVKIPSRKLTVVIFSNRNNEDTVLKIGDYLLAGYSEGTIPLPATDQDK
jgi:CubicO group peptidase (beta-lactamase class C family)